MTACQNQDNIIEMNNDANNPPTNPAPTPSHNEAGGAAVAERPATTARTAPPKVDKLPPFRVLLHNDSVNDVDYVVQSVQSLMGYPLPKAAEITLEAHQKGLAEVIVTHRERAELYCEQFRTMKLSATAEPVA